MQELREVEPISRAMEMIGNGLVQTDGCIFDAAPFKRDVFGISSCVDVIA